MKKIYLILEDGKTFEGYSFGADVDCVGELVFQTSMVGYIETLTDPAYYGQIVLQTFPMIGNYGIIPADFDGKCGLSGDVVREWCETPSNFRCEYTLDKFLKDNNVPGICGIDTRELTKILREKGTMKATICSEIPDDLTNVREFTITSAVSKMTSDEVQVYEAISEAKYSVTVIDYGMRRYLADELTKRGCKVTVVPASTSAEKILETSPDGILLSGGPGDPAEEPEYIETVRKLFGKQPVKMVGTDRTYITNQNHGYAVTSNNISNGVVSFVNANDQTCEGIEYAEAKAFSVQFYPEVNSGAHSTSFVFDKFVEMMGGQK